MRASDVKFLGGGKMVRVCGVCRQPLAADGRCRHIPDFTQQDTEIIGAPPEAKKVAA